MITTADVLQPETTVRSFRDPGGVLIRSKGAIYRHVSAEFSLKMERFLHSESASEAMNDGDLVQTWQVSRADTEWALIAPCPDDGTVLQHERIEFPSYPYEWSPAMLHAAGSLTLRLAQAVLPEGFGLKDATPYNVVFRGPKPVFVDFLSFEQRTPGDPIWLPYAQFQRMFLLPLLLMKHFGVPGAEIFMSRPDGIEPEEVYKRCNFLKRLSPAFLGSVSVPTWLNGRASEAGKSQSRQLMSNTEKAQYILEFRFRGLQKAIDKSLPRSAGNSAWCSYMRTLSYSDQDFQLKTETVDRWLRETQPNAVLDVGCNTGHFSALAASRGARVVSIDSDPAVVDAVWNRARREQLDILPLVVNLARPTPACGWLNLEYPSFLERATGGFKVVMMLAVIHHMLVTERIPLPQILELAARISTGHVIVEYVSKEDAMFRKLTRGRDSLYEDFNQGAFEDACHARFKILKKQPLKANLRCLYLLEKR